MGQCGTLMNLAPDILYENISVVCLYFLNTLGCLRPLEEESIWSISVLLLFYRCTRPRAESSIVGNTNLAETGTSASIYVDNPCKLGHHAGV